MAPTAHDRWEKSFCAMDFRMNMLMHTHICWALVSKCLVSGGKWVVLGFSLMALSPCWDIKSPPFSVSHFCLHTLTQSLHPSWIDWWDSVAIRNIQAIFIFCGGCNGKEKVTVPIVSRGNASLSFIGTNTHGQWKDHSLGKARETVSKGGSTWKAIGPES